MRNLNAPKPPSFASLGVPQVMNARRVMIATVAPAQLLAQGAEDAMHLAITQRQPMPLASRADEERGFECSGLTRQVERTAVSSQCFDGARVHGHLTRLAELGFTDEEHPAPEIDVLVAQCERLADAQSSAGNKTEQRLEDDSAQRR